MRTRLESCTSHARATPASGKVARVPIATQLDLLIAAAHPAELAGLRVAWGRPLSSRVRGLHVAARAIGVGLPAAAVGAARAICELRPRALVLLGSCGVYPSATRAAGPARGAARATSRHLLIPAIPERVQLVDAAVLGGRAAFPGPMPSGARLHRALTRGLARCAPGALRGTLATTAGITTSNALARRIARETGCETENLEALGVALACEAERVAFAALLVVTNTVGSRGRAQWLEHHAAAAERGARVLTEWLALGAPGLQSGL